MSLIAAGNRDISATCGASCSRLPPHIAFFNGLFWNRPLPSSRVRFDHLERFFPR